MVGAKVALKPVTGLMMPRQFGPTMRMRPRRASSASWCSSSSPGAPVSLNPAEVTIALVTPASTHSRTIDGTMAAGVTMTARSTRSGTAAIAGYARTPRMLEYFGFTGYTVPPNGLLIRFHKMVRPTVPGRSVAPTTATVFGEKSASSG
jgi:hypothetical protein